VRPFADRAGRVNRANPPQPFRGSFLSQQKSGFVNFLQEFSIPLLAGVACALVAANLNPDWYHHWFGAHSAEGHEVWTTGLVMFGHDVNLFFLINDIFMVFFFGIAAKEITESCLPGGSLSPIKKAINPLIATIGGVAGPVGAFFLFMFMAHSMGLGGYDKLNDVEWAAYLKGWGIPTATDIALAWLVARAVFGKGHPAVNFLLLLAVADDAIGLGIIAIFYGDPANPAAPEFLGLVALGMAVAFALRRMKVQSWVPYILIAGPISWCGLVLAHLHPALALVPIVPFLPGPRRDTGLFSEEDEVDVMGEETARDLGMHHSPLHNYEHHTKAFVDFGLFFFAMGNAGVQFGGIGAMTWVILGSLVVGKTVGITLTGLFAKAIGFPLPAGMGFKELVMAGFVAALGLTVALFVAGAAFPTDLDLQGQAKMGALFSGFVGVIAILLGRMLGMGKPAKD
jgi:Na+:H+ antiporter, NhaA family